MIKKYIDKKFKEREEKYNRSFNKAVDNITERVLNELPQTVENILDVTLKQIANDPNPSGFVYTFKTKVTPLVLRALERELKELKNKNQRLYEIKHEAKKLVRDIPKDEKFIQKIIDEINKKQLKK